MKGIFFLKPLELAVVIQGEAWNQGEPVEGTLKVTNHGSEPVSLETVRLTLALGGLKRVSLKGEDAFDLLEHAELKFDSPGLGAGASTLAPWRFSLERDCAITDSTRSLFVVYGKAARGAELDKIGPWDPGLGHLQLKVVPNPVIREFVDVLKTHFRFVPKILKNGKGASVEFKLAPPTAKGFSSLDSLQLGLRMEGDILKITYAFNLKKVEATASSVELSKQKLEAEQSYSPDEYRLPSGRFNTDPFEAGIREALALIGSKIAS